NLADMEKSYYDESSKLDQTKFEIDFIEEELSKYDVDNLTEEERQEYENLVVEHTDKVNEATEMDNRLVGQYDSLEDEYNKISNDINNKKGEKDDANQKRLVELEKQKETEQDEQKQQEIEEEVASVQSDIDNDNKDEEIEE